MAIGISVFDNVVYYGPNPIHYPKIGTIKAKTKVTIMWRENEWFYIEYFDGVYKKRGYIQDIFINYIIGKVVSVPLVTTTKITVDNVSAYLGPMPNIYAKAGAVFKYEPLTVFNVTLGDYTFVEYRIKNNQKKRAFIANNSINLEANSALIPFIGTRLADFSNELAYGSGSFYSKASLRGQCTWYCWGRAKEKCNKRLVLEYPNNAHNWLENCTSGYTRKESNTVPPMKNAIACFTGGNYGHVVFIEDVEKGFIYYTEANANNNSIIDANDGILKISPENEFRYHLGKSLQGYIVL